MPFPIHPHMLRHACGYALANAGHDTRALQAWLGHIQKWRRTGSETSGETENAPADFPGSWRAIDQIQNAPLLEFSQWQETFKCLV